MSTNQLEVLLVEDSRSFITLMESICGDTINLTVKSDKASGFSAIEQNSFDLVLLDLHLPDGNSLDLCERILGLSDHPPSVIYISGEENLEWRLRAYAAGAENFIPKTIGAEELWLKLSATFKYHERHRSSISKAKESLQDLQDSYLTDTSDSAILREFYKRCMFIHHPEEFKKATRYLMEKYQFSFVLQIDLKGYYLRIKNDESEFSPIEESLFEQLSESGANIQSFGTNTYFHAGDVELIIQNMPIENTKRYQNLLDQIHIVAGVMNDKTQQLLNVLKIESSFAEIIEDISGNNGEQAIEKINQLKSELNTEQKEDDSEEDDIVFF